MKLSEQLFLYADWYESWYVNTRKQQNPLWVDTWNIEGHNHILKLFYSHGHMIGDIAIFILLEAYYQEDTEELAEYLEIL